MYTILVVDDETLVRQDIIYKVGASGFSFDWIMEASDTEEALKIIAANRPDLMLTDIMMRGRTGLDLVEEAATIYPGLVTCVICGHPDFSFAQRALKLGVSDYLLKPVTKQQLSTVLAKLCAKVQEKRRTGQLQRDNYLLKSRLASREFQEQIGALLSGTAGFDTEAITGALPAGSKCFQLQILHMNFPENTRDQDNRTMRYGAQNIAEELGHGCLLAVPGRHRNEVVSIVGTTLEGASAERHLRKLGAQIRLAVANGLHCRTDMGLSSVSCVLASSYYLEAQKALDLRFGGSSLACDGALYALLPQPIQEDHSYHESDVVMFKRFLDCGDVKNAVTAARNILETYRSSREPGIRDTYVELVGVLSRFCYRKGIGILSMLGYENISGSLLDSRNTLDEIIDNITMIIETAMSHWVKNMEDTSDVLRQVKSYIDENFSHSELCTKELSKRFCISLGYLSASYKKNYGITISKYIISQRMEYACKLLRETDFSIQTVSENSGFNNLSYFMRVFKAHYGTTPSQYREKN